MTAPGGVEAGATMGGPGPPTDIGTSTGMTPGTGGGHTDTLQACVLASHLPGDPLEVGGGGAATISAGPRTEGGPGAILGTTSGAPRGDLLGRTDKDSILELQN